MWEKSASRIKDEESGGTCAPKDLAAASPPQLQAMRRD